MGSRRIPNTGSQTEMGRVHYALNLNAGTYPPAAGSNISLNGTLGGNRSNLNVSTNIAAGGTTTLTDNFGGRKSDLQIYPWWVYDAYVQVCSGGVCADTGGVIKVHADTGIEDNVLTNGGYYSDGGTAGAWRIISARYVVLDLTGVTVISNATARASSYCCL